MKTLVTGGTGFIGSHLIEKLIDKHHSIICLANDRGHYDSFQSTLVKLKICDLNNLAISYKYENNQHIFTVVINEQNIN